MSASPHAFDVPGYVATMADCPRSEVSFAGQSEAGDTLTTRYVCKGTTNATVELVALLLPGGRRGNWQLVARVGKHVGGAQLPSATRFNWR